MTDRLAPCRCGHPGSGCTCYGERLAEHNHRRATPGPARTEAQSRFRADLRRAVEQVKDPATVTTSDDGAWIAYYSDGSGWLIFDTEIAALRYALGYSMEVKFAGYGDPDWRNRPEPPVEHVHGAWCHPSADGCPDDLR